MSDAERQRAAQKASQAAGSEATGGRMHVPPGQQAAVAAKQAERKAAMKAQQSKVPKEATPKLPSLYKNVRGYTTKLKDTPNAEPGYKPKATPKLPSLYKNVTGYTTKLKDHPNAEQQSKEKFLIQQETDADVDRKMQKAAGYKPKAKPNGRIPPK